MNIEFGNLTKKIYKKQIEKELETLKLIGQAATKVERKDISKLRKFWNIITFRKHKNYVIEFKPYKVINIGKPAIKVGDDK